MQINLYLEIKKNKTKEVPCWKVEIKQDSVLSGVEITPPEYGYFKKPGSVYIFVKEDPERRCPFTVEKEYFSLEGVSCFSTKEEADIFYRQEILKKLEEIDRYEEQFGKMKVKLLSCLKQ